MSAPMGKKCHVHACNTSASGGWRQAASLFHEKHLRGIRWRDIFCPPVYTLAPEHTHAQIYITLINTHIRTLTYWKRRGGAYMRRAWIHRTAKASEKDSHSSCLNGVRDYS